MLGIVYREFKWQCRCINAKHNTSDLTRKETQSEMLRATFAVMVTLSQSLWKFLLPYSQT